MNPDITAPSLSSVRRYHPTPALDFAAYFFNSLLGVEDAERTAKAIKGIEGKRLTYRRTNQASNA